MDTRSKILTPRQALEVAGSLRAEGRPLVVVTGYFDPVVAEHARRLEAARRGAGALMVVILTPPAPILAARARAELAAALAVVDYVVLSAGPGTDEFLGLLPEARIERHEASDERLTQELIANVGNRQHAS